MKSPVLSWFLFIPICWFVSCASDASARVDAPAYKGHYADSLEVLEKNKNKIYKDPVLYYLDKGILAHYAGEYGDSTELLQRAEQAIAEAFTKSITQEIASYILNDTVKDYPGEDYEDIYSNAFNALSYYHLNKYEDALVEIRRMNEKLSFLADKYGEVLTNLQDLAEEKTGSAPASPGGQTRFFNSAFARYLGMLFYRGGKYDDDARIDYTYLKAAFAAAPKVYPHPAPRSLDDELAIPPGKARLNVVSFSGLSPIKEEETLRIPLFLPSLRYIKIALPVMSPRVSAAARIETVLNTGASFTLELLEDLEAVAQETFKQRLEVIYLKSIIRGSLKGFTSSALGAAAEKTDDISAALVLGILSLGAQVLAETSEQADLRISRYFPGKVYIGGLTVDPGVYSVTVNYYAKNGALLASFTQEKMYIRENKLNLMETVCLK
ncbi:MAG: hypothetical protein LBG90_07790 [Spirochaetaceae bacterium]|jgi:hypothetical protein|nr:hypothetical protein [Spirochaetaceae bacterium]